MGVVRGICIKYPGGPTRMRGADIPYDMGLFYYGRPATQYCIISTVLGAISC
jgi:hypothetical protein